MNTGLAIELSAGEDWQCVLFTFLLFVLLLFDRYQLLLMLRYMRCNGNSYVAKRISDGGYENKYDCYCRQISFMRSMFYIVLADCYF